MVRQKGFKRFLPKICDREKIGLLTSTVEILRWLKVIIPIRSTILLNYACDLSFSFFHISVQQDGVQLSSPNYFVWNFFKSEILFQNFPTAVFFQLKNRKFF